MSHDNLTYGMKEHLIVKIIYVNFYFSGVLLDILH